MRLQFLAPLSLVFLLAVAACGGSGGSSELTFESAEGSWEGREYQAGVVTCGDGVIVGAGAGSEYADAEVEVELAGAGETYRLIWETSFACDKTSCPVEPKACTFTETKRASEERFVDGSMRIVPVIYFAPPAATPEGDSSTCAEVKEVSLILETDSRASVFSSHIPPVGNICYAAAGANLNRK